MNDTPASTVELLKAELILLIVTVLPPTVLPVVDTPDPFTTRPPASAILITTPASGCVLGKAASVAITSRPPIGAI